MKDNLDCLIYADTDLDQEILAKMIAGVVSGMVSGPVGARTVSAQDSEIDLRRNKTTICNLLPTDHDAFLYFRHLIEVYQGSDQPESQRVGLVNKLLLALWSMNIPAVAACDFEDQLPRFADLKGAIFDSQNTLTDLSKSR